MAGFCFCAIVPFGLYKHLLGWQYWPFHVQRSCVFHRLAKERQALEADRAERPTRALYRAGFRTLHETLQESSCWRKHRTVNQTVHQAPSNVDSGPKCGHASPGNPPSHIPAVDSFADRRGQPPNCKIWSDATQRHWHMHVRTSPGLARFERSREAFCLKRLCLLARIVQAQNCRACNISCRPAHKVYDDG